MSASKTSIAASMLPSSTEPDALVVERHPNSLAQRRLARLAEAGDEHVINFDLRLAAPELAERDALVDERYGDLFVQRWLARFPEAGDERVKDLDCRLDAAQFAEPDALVVERHRGTARATPAR